MCGKTCSFYQSTIAIFGEGWRCFNGWFKSLYPPHSAVYIALGVMNTIYDEIMWLKSQATTKLFPIVLFSGDTDMVTAGRICLTSTEHTEIVVTELTAEEYCSQAEDPSRYLHAEQRVNSTLSRSDLRCSWLVRAEQVLPKRGLSFQEFRKLYQPPKLFFRDIFSTGSVAEEFKRVTRSEFERDGGKVTVVR